MDFKSFQKTFKQDSPRENHNDDIRKKAEEYGKKSEEELLGEILKAAKVGKENGSLTDGKLQEFASQVAPLLNEEQRARLESVIKMIRN